MLICHLNILRHPEFVLFMLWSCCCVSPDDLNGQTTLLVKTVYGVENSSTFLECTPKSQRALTYWQYQQPNDDRKQEVSCPLTVPSPFPQRRFKRTLLTLVLS